MSQTVDAWYEFDDMLEPVKGSGWCYVEPRHLPFLEAWWRRFGEESERSLPFVALIVQAKANQQIYLNGDVLCPVERVMVALRKSLTLWDRIKSRIGMGILFDPTKMLQRLNSLS